MENDWHFFPKVTHRVTIRPSNFTPRYTLKRKESIYPNITCILMLIATLLTLAKR